MITKRRCTHFKMVDLLDDSVSAGEDTGRNHSKKNEVPCVAILIFVCMRVCERILVPLVSIRTENEVIQRVTM